MIQQALGSSSSLRLAESVASRTLLDKGYQYLEEHASTIPLEPSETLLHEGEEGDRFYVVAEGSIEAVDQSGKVMHVFQKNDRFGEHWLLFPHEPAGATCRAGPEGASLKAVTRADFQSQFSHCFINAGPVRGRVVRAKASKKTRFLDKDICEFRGIRYATRTSRFALPDVKDLRETEAVDAFEFGPECVQVGGLLFDQLVPPQPERSRPSLLRFIHNKPVSAPSEDCLCLNVYAPLGAGGGVSPAKLPVMVWIHGGAFLTGSGSLPMYNGRELASKGTVVVTINYRLGALGFLSGLEDVPLNLGLHDQIAALRWVKKHIALFGGDAQNVTVFGESAGAMSVACLLGMKVRRQEQLFQKAIVQSGTAYAVLSQSQGEHVAKVFADFLAAELKMSGQKITREVLDTCPVDSILKATEATSRKMAVSDLLRGVIMPFQPCCWENGPVSYDLLFECVHPLVQVARGIAQDVTMMIGVNNNEYTLFMLDNYWRRLFAKAKGSKKAFKTMLEKKILTWAHAEDRRYRALPDVEARVKRIVDFYLPDKPGSDEITEEEAGSAFERIHSVWLFDQGADTLAVLKHGDGSGKPVYTYRLFFLASMNHLGSPHALDLPLVFGSFRTDALAGMLTGDGPEAVECSKQMMSAWISFAKTGNPGWNPQYPKAFGRDASAPPLIDLPPTSVFSSKAERELWSEFMERVELNMKVCKARANL